MKYPYEALCATCGQTIQKIRANHIYCKRTCNPLGYVYDKRKSKLTPEQLSRALALGSSVHVQREIEQLSDTIKDAVSEAIDHKISLPAQHISVKGVVNLMLTILNKKKRDFHQMEMRIFYQYVCDELEKRGGMLSELRGTIKNVGWAKTNSNAIYEFPPLKERKK